MSVAFNSCFHFHGELNDEFTGELVLYESYRLLTLGTFNFPFYNSIPHNSETCSSYMQCSPDLQDFQ